jgi:hypothetical protein
MSIADLHRAYRDELLAHGLLISMGVDGLYGRSGTFEAVVDGINRAVAAVGDADRPEVMRFPPGIGKWQLEQSGYLKSSPQLVGTVHSFTGSDADRRARTHGGRRRAGRLLHLLLSPRAIGRSGTHADVPPARACAAG